MTKYIFILIFILSVFLSCSEDSGNNSVDPTFSSIYSEIVQDFSLDGRFPGRENGLSPIDRRKVTETASPQSRIFYTWPCVPLGAFFRAC